MSRVRTVPRFPLLVLGYVGGLVAGQSLDSASLMLLAAACGCAALAWHRTSLILPAAVLVGVVGGSVSGTARARSCAIRWPEGARVSFIADVHDAPALRPTTTASVWHAREGCDGQIRLRLVDSIPAGARAIVVGDHQANGVVRVLRVRVLGAPRHWRFRVREGVARRIRHLYGARAPLIEAMVIGRRDDLASESRQAFAAAGLAHLLAISGLHVGIFAVWVTLAGRTLGLGTAAPIVGIPVVWGYVVLLGFPAPATRAAAFVTALALARRLQRHPPPSAILALGVAAVATIDPDAVRSVGAWLSVSAVWGVAAAARTCRGYRGRAQDLVRLFAASVGATLATAPVSALVFGQVAPVGILANIVGVPLAAMAVPGVLVSLVVGRTFAAGVAVLLTGLERWVELMARVPGGAVTGVAGVSFALPWAALLVGAVWMVRERVVRIARLILGLGALAAWVPVGLVLARRDVESAPLAIHLLDVGQGDAIALRTPAGKWVLVDAGPRIGAADAGRRVVVPFFRRRGVTRLAAMFVSHGDADHVGGAPAVLREIPADLVVEPGVPLPSPIYREFLAAVDAGGMRWQPGRRGDSLMIDGVAMTLLHPTEAWLRREARPNEGSLVMHVRFGCFDALLTGDAGLPVEDAVGDGWEVVEVLKVGHHGSRTATGKAFLRRVRPQVALISVGTNRYGHPSAPVVARLEASGAHVLRTDRDGAVTIRTDGRYLEVDASQRLTTGGWLTCLQHWLRSSDSSSSRSGCTRRPRVNLPICSTTSPSRPR